MSTLSNVEFLRRLKQGRGVYTPSFASDFENEAYFESILSGQMLQNESDAEISNLIKNNANLQYSYQKEPTIDQIEKSTSETLNGWERTQATINEVTYNVGKGVLGFVEGIGDFLIGAAGEIGSWFGADDQWAKDAINYDWSSRAAQAINNLSAQNWDGNIFDKENWDFSDEGVQKYNQDLYEASFINEAPTWFHDGFINVANTIANMVPSIVIGVVTGGAGASSAVSKIASVGSMALSAGGSSALSALEENPEADLSNVMLYGVASGAVEGASEYVLSGLGKVGSKISGKIGVPTGKLANLLPNSVNGFFGKQVSKNFLGQITAEAIEEGAEEVFSDVLQPLIKSIYNGKSVKENYDEYTIDSAIESFIMGGITAGIMGGAHISLNRIKMGGKNAFNAGNILSDVREDYNKLVSLQSNGQATEITSDGSLQYNDRAQAIVKDMVEKLEEHNRLIDKMSSKEKASYFKYLTGMSVEDSFEALQEKIDIYNKQYEEQKSKGVNSQVLENIKKYKIDPIQKILEEGKDRWTTRKIQEQVNEFVPYFENASQVKLAQDDKIFKKHLRKHLKHSSLNNESQLNDDINEIKQDLARLDKTMSETEKINFGKKLTSFGSLFGDLDSSTKAKLLETFNEYINSMKNATVQEEIIKYQVYNFQENNLDKFSLDTKIMFENGEANGEPARFNRDKNIIYINRHYANRNNYSKILAHEYVGHVLYDNLLSAERDQIVEQIKETNWYKENKESFERTYNFNEKSNIEKYNSELFANYLENVVFNKTSDISGVFNVLSKPNRLFTSIKSLLKSINKSNADNLFLDELSRTLRLIRSAGYRAWRLAIRNGVSFSRNLYDKDSVEYLMRGDISEQIKPDYKYQKSNAYDINDSDFDTTDFECYDENAAKYNKLAINVNDNMVLNFLRYINSLTLEDLTYDDTFGTMTQALTERLEKINSYLKKGNNKKFTQQDFINAQRLYNYLIENNDSDLNKFYKKSESYARRIAKEDGEQFDSDEWSFDDFDIGNIFEEADNFKNNYKSFMLKNYKYDVDEKRIISDSPEVQIAKVDEQEVKDIIEDNASQLKADENIDQGASEKVVNRKIENTINKIERASISEKYQKQISNFNQDILSLSTVNAQNISTIIEANKKLAKQIRSFRTADYNLTTREFADNFSKLEVVTEEQAKDAYNLAETLTDAFSNISYLLLKKEGSGSILPISEYADLNKKIYGDLSSQQIGDVSKSLIDLINALYDTYYNPATDILKHFTNLTTSSEQGEGDFYVQDVEGNWLEMSENSGMHFEDGGNDYSNLLNQLDTDGKGLLNNLYKSGVNKGLSNWGKQRNIRNTTYVTSVNANKIQPIEMESITGYTKGDVPKTVLIKWVREEDYIKLMNIPGLAIHSKALPGSESSRKKLVTHYAIIEENVGDQKNLSGFSRYNLGSRNANFKQSMVINSFFNLGNNMLVYENIGSFIRTKVFGQRFNDSPFGRRTPSSPNAVALLMDFGRDYVMSQDALTKLSDYEIYPVFNVISTSLETKKITKNSAGKTSEVETIQYNADPYKKNNAQYIFNLSPSMREKRSDLRQVPVQKVGKKIDEKNKILTYSLAINRALENSRTSVNSELDKIRKAKKQELNDIYSAKSKIRTAEKQGYKKGLKESKKLLSKEFKKGVEEGKKILLERQERLKQIAKEVEENNNIYNNFTHELTGTFLSTKSVFKEERKRLKAEVDNGDNMSQLTSQEKEAYVRKGMREFASKYKQNLIKYAKSISGNDVSFNLLSGTAAYIEDAGVSTIDDYISANSIVDTNLFTNNTLFSVKTTGEPLTEEEKKVIKLLVDQGKGNVPTSLDGSTNKIVQFQIPNSSDSVVAPVDVGRKVEVQNPNSVNPLQEKINLKDSFKVKLAKLKNNIAFSQWWLSFQTLLTNNFATYEKAIILNDAGDYKTAENYSYGLRRMNNVGTNFIERGMPTYDANGQRIHDEKGREVLTRSLSEANYLVKQIMKKKGADKTWREKLNKRFNDAQEKILRDQYAYMISDLAIDTNKNYNERLKTFLSDFIVKNNIDVEYDKAFEKTINYIENQAKSQENIHYQELYSLMNSDLLNLYKEGLIEQNKIDKLLSSIPDITDDVVFKDTFGKSFEYSKFVSLNNETLYALNDRLGKINGLSLVDSIKEKFANRTDIFLEEYEDISKDYLTQSQASLENIRALESDFHNDFYLDTLDEETSKLISEISNFFEKKNNLSFADTLLKKKDPSGHILFSDYQSTLNEFKETKNVNNLKKTILNKFIVNARSVSEGNLKLKALSDELKLVNNESLISTLLKETESSNVLSYSDYRKVLNKFVSLENLENNQIQKLQNALIHGFEGQSTKRLELLKSKIREEYQNTPEFFTAIDIYRENLDSHLAFLREGGIITDSDYNLMKNAYPHYVPTRRHKIQLGSGIVGRTDLENIVRYRDGSNEVILPLNETIINMLKIAPFKVELNKQLDNIYNANNKGNHLISFSKIGDDKTLFTDVIEQDINDISLSSRDGNAINFRHYNKDESKMELISANMENHVYSAFRTEKFFKSTLNLPSKFVSTFKRLVTSYNPFFILRNYQRDIIDAYATSRGNLVSFTKELGKSVVEIVKGDSVMWNLYVQNGGLASSYFDTSNSSVLFEDLAKTYQEGNSKVHKVLHSIEKANMVVEQLARFTEFKVKYQEYLKEGMSEEIALSYALLDAAQITTDFSRGGTLAKWLNRNFVPFLNAQIQGWCKISNIILHPKNKRELASILAKIIILAIVPEVLNMLLNGGNPDYEALPDYTKESYYLINTGNGNFLKIPRARIVGTFSSLFNNIVDIYNGSQNPIEALNDFWDTATTNLAPVDVSGGINYIGKPIQDALSNRTWYGQSIDKQSDLTKRPSSRYDTETSEVAKFIGKIFNWSPKRIDYVLAQSTGVVGDILLPLTTQSGSVENTLMNFLTSNTSISAVQNNKYRGEFYDYRTEVQYDASDGDPVAKVVYGYLSRAIDEINVLEEQADQTTNKAEKYTIYLTIRESYKQAVENAENFKKVLSHMDQATLESGDKYALTEAYYQAFGAEAALKYYNSSTYKKATYGYKAGVSYYDYYNLYFAVRSASSKDEARKMIQSVVGNNASQVAAMLKLLGISLTDSEKSLAKTYLSKFLTDDELADLSL